ISYTSVESVTDLVADGIAGLAPSVSEGATLSLAVSPFDPDNSGFLLFNWSLTRNGQPFASGTGPAFAGAVGDDGDYKVTLTTTNTDNNAVGTTVASFVVTNAPPTVANDTATTDEDTPVTV